MWELETPGTFLTSAHLPYEYTGIREYMKRTKIEMEFFLSLKLAYL